MIVASLKLDHVTMVVPDLDEVRASFAGLGFTEMTYSFKASPASGGLETLVIPFADGSQLHVVCLKRAWRRGVLYAARRLGLLEWLYKKRPPPVQRLVRAVAAGPGYAEAALQMPALDVLAAAMGARGYESDGTYPAVHYRHDGLDIRYHILSIPGVDPLLPLIISDETPVALRIPAPENCYHVNGVRGIAGYTVPVHNMAEASARWSALTGARGEPIDPPEGTLDAIVFPVGAARVTLVTPLSDDGLFAQILKARGEKPAEVMFWVRHGLKSRRLPLEMTQGVAMRFEPLPDHMPDPAPWDEDGPEDKNEDEAEDEFQAALSDNNPIETNAYDDWRTPPGFGLPPQQAPGFFQRKSFFKKD